MMISLTGDYITTSGKKFNMRRTCFNMIKDLSAGEVCEIILALLKEDRQAFLKDFFEMYSTIVEEKIKEVVERVLLEKKSKGTTAKPSRDETIPRYFPDGGNYSNCMMPHQMEARTGISEYKWREWIRNSRLKNVSKSSSRYVVWINDFNTFVTEHPQEIESTLETQNLRKRSR